MVETEPGIRAEIKVNSPSDCPIACVSEKNDVKSRSVSRTSSMGSPLVTEEVVFDSESVDPEEISGDVDADGTTRMNEVFSYGSKSVYRFNREQGKGCACECVESFGYPVVDTHARGGDLFLTFHVPDTETLKQVIGRLGERYSHVEVKRLIRSKDGEADSDLVLVDRSELTERQEEALRTAHEMGYFEHPKGANAGEVAEELGITTSTFTEHLAAAQKKLMRSIVEG